MVGRAGSATGTVHADVTLTRSKVKVKVTGLLNFRILAKPCMHAGGDDRQPPCGAFWFLLLLLCVFLPKRRIKMYIIPVKYLRMRCAHPVDELRVDISSNSD